MYIEIIPYLFIGDEGNQTEFDIIINCHKTSIFLEKNNSYKLNGQVNVRDYGYLDELTTYIYKNIISHKSIILLDNNSFQYGFTIACVYLIKYGKCKIKDILIKLKSKMDIKYSRLIYLDIFYKFEKNFLSM